MPLNVDKTVVLVLTDIWSVAKFYRSPFLILQSDVNGDSSSKFGCKRASASLYMMQSAAPAWVTLHFFFNVSESSGLRLIPDYSLRSWRNASLLMNPYLSISKCKLRMRWITLVYFVQESFARCFEFVSLLYELYSLLNLIEVRHTIGNYLFLFYHWWYSFYLIFI